MNLYNAINAAKTVSNAFEGNETVFLSSDSRATQRRKGKKIKRKRSAKWLNTEHEDADIAHEIRQHGEHNVHVHQ